MPKLKSSIKRLRQAQKARLRNRASRSLLRTTIKRVRTTPDKAEAEALLPGVLSVIDKSAKKGIIHRNTAARYKSKLTRMVSALEA